MKKILLGNGSLITFSFLLLISASANADPQRFFDSESSENAAENRRRQAIQELEDRINQMKQDDIRLELEKIEWQMRANDDYKRFQ